MTALDVREAPPLRLPVRHPAFAANLATHGERVALVEGQRTVTYTELADRADEVGRALGPVRRLVLVTGVNDLTGVATYLGALRGGHVVLLVPGGDPRRLAGWVQTYDPDVVIARRDGHWSTDVRRDGSDHDLHADLALLLSTSGSTGSPKLVRLSYDNLNANAGAIVDTLGVGPGDRAVTTLPMAYCYGLSVLHTHLLVGARVVLTELSVLDRCFWDLCREQRVSTLAGVPYTFELLDRVGFLDLDLPSLRTLTQAGGAMPTERIERYAKAGAQQGFRLHVMYGQTEATARMACLPPEQAASRPSAIGRALPGGALTLDETVGAEAGVGELVYTGPNVMLGYAEDPADLGLGRTVHALRTGDLARVAADGLFEIVGRRARFAKPLGLRVDLDGLGRQLAADGTPCWCLGLGDRVVVLSELPGLCPRRAASWAGLPATAIDVRVVGALPRLDNGKIDAPAAAALAAAPTHSAHRVGPPGSVAALFADVLGVDVAPDDTFVALGGDSLSYVEVALRLEELLGPLPPDWHLTPVGRLQPAVGNTAAPGSRRPSLARVAVTRVDGTVVLRALAIVLIVGTHTHLFSLVGGAHALLAVAGYNFARFRLPSAPRTERVRGMAHAASRVLLPTVVVIGLAALVTPGLGLVQAAMLNSVLGPDTLGPTWRYWFVEALLQVLLLVGVLLAIPRLDRAERVRPLAFAGTLLAVGLLLRFTLPLLATGPEVTQSGAAVLWLFAGGWCAALAKTHAHRLLLTGAALVALPGFFGDAAHELVVATLLVLVIWTRTLPVPRWALPLLGALAGSSLWTYLVHWQVLPLGELLPPVVVLALCLFAGFACWRLAAITPQRLAAFTPQRLAAFTRR